MTECVAWSLTSRVKTNTATSETMSVVYKHRHYSSLITLTAEDTASQQINTHVGGFTSVSSWSRVSQCPV